ncbi:MAG: DNA polymerase domain-containing protein, partial [bacterium]
PECLLDCDVRDVAAAAAAVCGEVFRAEIGDALARAAATALISDTLLPAEFFQAQMIPIPLGKLCMAGSAKKIDYLMIRAYLSAGHSIPKPPRPETFEGGLCEQLIAGRCENVVKLDVESQYPSLMIGEEIKPESDSLDVFLPMLKKLTWLRLEAKMKRDSASGPQRDRHDHLQKALKLLINSFYGYLGYRNAYFADFSAAARVTALGRAVMKKMIETLEGSGCSLIQCDTDGAFFTPPFDPESDRERLVGIVEAVEKSLPQYLDIAVEGAWPAMLSLKKKNYALLAGDGSVSITGGILKSSADERFVRKALAAAAECILKNDLSGLHTNLCSVREDVSDGRLSLPDICLSETIRMNDQEYRKSIADGGGRKPVYEAMLMHKKNKGDRVFLVGGDVRHYHRDNQGQTVGLPAFSFEFDHESPDYDRSHYRNHLNRALRRLQPLFTPEQYAILFEKALSETALRAAEKISVGAAVVVKKTSGGLDRYIELSAGYKKGKGVKRNVFVKADDAEVVREFREKHSDTDVYRSTYEYLCDRTPEKGITRFCPKRGGFVIELENETGEHPENVAGALEAARHCAEVIERTLAIPRDAVSYFYNGGKSFYLTIPQQSLGLSDCVELNFIYERIARHVRDSMDEEHRGAMDMNIYNHDRPFRIPGTTHPKHGLYNTRLATEEFFNLTAQDIIKLSRLPRETTTGELRFEDYAETNAIIHDLTKDIPRTEYFDPTRKPLRINMERKNWRAKITGYLRDRGVPVCIPCVETLTALIQSGGHTGFEGRVKLVTELRDAGETEEEIIRIFMDSPHFHEKYFNDIVLPDTRSGDERNGTGYMIRPDIWNDYSGISCARCQEWCSPGDCYRNTKIQFFNEADSPDPAEFRDTARDALRAALTEIMFVADSDGPPDMRINLIEAPMASGKTYQAVSMALELAAKGKRSLILAPDHTVCAEAVSMADGMEKTGDGTLVHLVGKNENSCADIAAMVGPCSSCKYGVKAVGKKAPEFIEELLSSLDGIYSLSRMKDMIAEMNNKPGATRMCLRTLSMLIAPRADIIVAPFVFLIDRNLSDILGELPGNIFIDEGDTFADHLADYCRRSLTVALPRVTNSGCIHSCRKPRCNHCKLSYSSVCVGGDMEPRTRATESTTFSDPADFIHALEDALHTVRQEIARGIVRRDIFDIAAVERNIGNLRVLLKPKSHYLCAGETDITVEEHLRRENAALIASPGATHAVVETGPVFGSEGEITKFPFVKIEKALAEPDEIQYDEEPTDRDSYAAFRFTVSSIYADRESYAYYKDGDPAYRNSINVFLKFAEFCEHAPGGALLRHVPKCGGVESACKIVLSYMDGVHFDDLMFLLMLRNTALMSGTFMKLRMAAAVLLLKESAIRYYTAPVKMHNKCTLVLHNNALGNVYMAGDVRDNPVKPKVLNYDSFFNFFNFCIGLLGDGIHLYYFGKNKNAARALYDAYKRNGGRLLFKANLVNSNGDIVFSGNDELLFQSNASPEARKHLERAS